jgi:hypothetical protein
MSSSSIRYGVQAFGWFVQNQQFRVVDDCRAKLHFLLLAARQFFDLEFGFVAQVYGSKAWG